MKKTLWFIFSGLAIFGIVLYLGNVFVIGEHLGRMLVFIGFPAAVTEWLTPAWDLVVGFLPLFFLLWCVAKSICGYGELNISALLGDEQDEQKVSRVLKSIANQPETTESTLDKHNLRDDCRDSLNSGSREEAQAFLKKYFDCCEKDAKKLASRYALFAAVSVVLSPKSAGDTLALVIWQCRIISSTLKIYGGRPSKTMVLRLYAKVLMHSAVAGSIDEVFDQFMYGAVDIKILSLFTQAIAAVATCVRTASLTRYYIKHGLDADRGVALKESLTDVRDGIIDVLKSPELKDIWFKSCKCVIELGKSVGKYTISFILPGDKGTDDDAGPEPEPVSNP